MQREAYRVVLQPSTWGLFIAAFPAEPDGEAPLSDDEFARGYTAMLARNARTRTGLSQQAFADRYGIPVASLRDWEQGRRSPDSATQNYLRVIAKLPDEVANALRGAAW